jgi:cellulose synthase/poly-beta-1,6-N-acetylglucosamine synthase-like glycosyltransferase
MFLSIIAAYVLCAAMLNPALWDLFRSSTGAIARLVLLLFIAQLNVFWLFGSYYLMLGVFTIIDLWLRSPSPKPVPDGAPVAILYVTMNDFQPAAALSCVRQNYGSCHLFILDDSVDKTWHATIDAFAEAHATKVTVIRRDNRNGYKAGSINSALRTQVRGFPFFVVADADSVLPSGFVSALVPYFELGDEIGWVQGSHAPNASQKTAFARDLALGILPLWEVYYGPRNRFGNVLFLGHGGMIRHDVWERAGGFPEIVSEDLAFSTKAAQLGYRGYFAHDVVSYEDFPAGYRQLRRQQAKYVKGACEYLHREYLPFLLSPKVRWFEKLDVLLSCGSLLIQPIVLAFMFVFCLFTPLLFGAWRPLTLNFLGRDLATVHAILLSPAFNNLWTWEYLVITVVCTFAPVLGCLGVIARQPRLGTKMVLVSAVPYLSMLVLSVATIASYLWSRRAVFLVTGDNWGVDPQNFPAGFSLTASVAERLGAEDRLTNSIELALGLLFAFVCVLTVNVSLLAFAISLMLSPVLLRVRWESRALRPLLLLPYALIIGGILLGGMNIAAAQGAAMSVFFFHS